MRRPAVLLAAVLAVSLAVSGCSSATPSATGSSPVQVAVPSLTPSASPTPTHPTARATPSTKHSTTAASVHRTTAAPVPTTRANPQPSPSLPTVPSGGITIALNPGHNGGNETHTAEIGRMVPSGFGNERACDTTGTNTDAGYPEHAFNWDVTMRVRAILQSHGVHVILTRQNDTSVGPCIDTRAAIANQKGVDAVVSIHADGAPSGGHGFHICEDSRQPAGPAIAAKSHSLTVALHNALVGGSGFTPSTYIGSDGYYPRDDLAGLNLATVPATFIELGNMRNSGDAAIQSSAAGRQRIATAIASGILLWVGAR